MDIAIKTEPKEIADPVLAIQSRQNQMVSNVTDDSAEALIEKAKNGDLDSFRVIKILLNS